MLLLRVASAIRPPISTPSLSSLLPSLKLSSPLLTPHLTCVLLHHQTRLLSKPLLAPNPSHHLQSFCFKWLLPLLGSHQFCPGGITGLPLYEYPLSCLLFFFADVWLLICFFFRISVVVDFF